MLSHFQHPRSLTRSPSTCAAFFLLPFFYKTTLWQFDMSKSSSGSILRTPFYAFWMLGSAQSVFFLCYRFDFIFCAASRRLFYIHWPQKLFGHLNILKIYLLQYKMPFFFLFLLDYFLRLDFNYMFVYIFRDTFYKCKMWNRLWLTTELPFDWMCILHLNLAT